VADVEDGHLNGVRHLPEGVQARAQDVGQAVVLPDQRPLGVVEVHDVELVAQDAVGQQDVEHGVREPRLGRVHDFDAVLAQVPDRDAVRARAQDVDEIAPAEPEAALVLLDVDGLEEHGESSSLLGCVYVAHTVILSAAKNLLLESRASPPAEMA
jgi:hypothetical protein